MKIDKRRLKNVFVSEKKKIGGFKESTRKFKPIIHSWMQCIIYVKIPILKSPVWQCLQSKRRTIRASYGY